jgi:hypothetical protein
MGSAYAQSGDPQLPINGNYVKNPRGQTVTCHLPCRRSTWPHCRRACDVPRHAQEIRGSGRLLSYRVSGTRKRARSKIPLRAIPRTFNLVCLPLTSFAYKFSPHNQSLAAQRHPNPAFRLRQSDRKCVHHAKSNPGSQSSNSRPPSGNPDHPAHIGIAFVIASTPLFKHPASPKTTKTEKVKTRNEVNLTSEKYRGFFQKNSASSPTADLPGFCPPQTSIAARI